MRFAAGVSIVQHGATPCSAAHGGETQHGETPNLVFFHCYANGMSQRYPKAFNLSRKALLHRAIKSIK
jgi:hypothetical protein